MMSASWAPMMAAMMLPGALPAIARSRRAPLFAGSYLVVWTLVGLAIYALHMPPTPAVWCMGSSLGVMAVLVALDPMNLPLMCAAGAIALIQKKLFA